MDVFEVAARNVVGEYSEDFKEVYVALVVSDVEDSDDPEDLRLAQIVLFEAERVVQVLEELRQILSLNGFLAVRGE